MWGAVLRALGSAFAHVWRNKGMYMRLVGALHSLWKQHGDDVSLKKTPFGRALLGTAQLSDLGEDASPEQIASILIGAMEANLALLLCMNSVTRESAMDRLSAELLNNPDATDHDKAALAALARMFERINLEN